MKEKDYEIIWHNMITGKSVKKIFTQVEDIVKDLKLLLKLEKAKKITLEEREVSPSISGIIINDEKVRKEVEKNGLVCAFDIEVEPDEKEVD